MSAHVIGVDVGFGNTKTAHNIFSSGVSKHATKPPISSMTVEYNGNFYSVGSPKLTVQESKIANEDMLILTLAAIATELKRSDTTVADIHLGVGVPLTRMGAEKKDVMEYYKNNRRLVFKYEDISYSINLLSVNVFPQGYAGVINYLNNFSKLALVIDIGSWTIDILPFREQKPDIANCKSLSSGTITCSHRINEALRSSVGGEIDDVFLRDVMINGTTSDLPDKYLEVVRAGLYDYVDAIMGQLRALQFNLETTQLVFIGGGSSIIKNFLDTTKYPNAICIDDICINAKGYEGLVRYQMRNGGLNS